MSSYLLPIGQNLRVRMHFITVYAVSSGRADGRIRWITYLHIDSDSEFIKFFVYKHDDNRQPTTEQHSTAKQCLPGHHSIPSNG